MAYVLGVPNVAAWVYIKAGRWWLYFGIMSVALNDASAYFAGRLFGRHHLIGLSPNKTIEGFVGGAILNIILCYVAANYYLQGDFWQCAPGRINVGLFEDWKCPAGVSSIYSE